MLLPLSLRRTLRQSHSAKRRKKKSPLYLFGSRQRGQEWKVCTPGGGSKGRVSTALEKSLYTHYHPGRGCHLSSPSVACGQFSTTIGGLLRGKVLLLPVIPIFVAFALVLTSSPGRRFPTFTHHPVRHILSPPPLHTARGHLDQATTMATKRSTTHSNLPQQQQAVSCAHAPILLTAGCARPAGCTHLLDTAWRWF